MASAHVLTAAATLPAAGLTGCSLRVGQPATASPPAGPSREELARGRAAADADALAAAAVRTASIVPSAARTLRTVADEHRAHATALRAGGAAARATPSPTAASASIVGLCGCSGLARGGPAGAREP